MKAYDSRDIIVDASVARSAGAQSESETPRLCRQFLLTMYEVCHKVLFTPDIRSEWQKHASSFTRLWRTQMVSRKKLTVIGAPRSPDLVNAIQSNGGSQRQRAAMTKDAHLIEAAFACGAPIASRDDAARDLFSQLVPALPGLAPVVWVNPANPAEDVAAWLRDGAPSAPARTLAHRREGGE